MGHPDDAPGWVFAVSGFGFFWLGDNAGVSEGVPYQLMRIADLGKVLDEKLSASFPPLAARERSEKMSIGLVLIFLR
jgi:hypothetical protein